MSRASVIDNLGNVYTTGSFQGTVDFDPGTGTYELTSVGETDIFISKLDANGNFLWAKPISTRISRIGHGFIRRIHKIRV